MVSQHLAASSADVHAASHAFSTTAASFVVFTMAILGFSPVSAMSTFATALVAASTSCEGGAVGRGPRRSRARGASTGRQLHDLLDGVLLLGVRGGGRVRAVSCVSNAF
jgi:hypothetical protein